MILGPNKISSRCGYAFTSAAESLAALLYDRDRAHQLASVGSDDVTPEIYEVDFGADTDIELIIFDNVNFGDYLVELYYSAAWHSIASGSNTAGTIIVETVGVVTASKLRLTVSTTIIANQQKKIGRMYAGAIHYQFSSAPVSYSLKIGGAQAVSTLLGGGSSVTTFDSAAEINLGWNNATAADIDALIELRDYPEALYFWPGGGGGYADYGYRDQDFWQVALTGDVSPAPRAGLIGAGSEVDVTLVEVG